MKCDNCGRPILNENNAVRTDDGIFGPVCAVKVGHFEEVTALHQIQPGSEDLYNTVIKTQVKGFWEFNRELKAKYNPNNDEKIRHSLRYNKEKFMNEEEKAQYLDFIEKQKVAFETYKLDTEFYADRNVSPTDFPVHPFLYKHFDPEKVPFSKAFAHMGEKSEFSKEKISEYDEEINKKNAIKSFCNMFIDPACSDKTFEMYHSLDLTLAVAHPAEKGFKSCFSVGSNSDEALPDRLVEIKIYDKPRNEFKDSGLYQRAGEINYLQVVDGQIRRLNLWPEPLLLPNASQRIKARYFQSKYGPDFNDKSMRQSSIDYHDRFIYALVGEWLHIRDKKDMPNIANLSWLDEKEFPTES